jgi:hypothetical protein
MATAWASNQGGEENCLKPFVIPDMWYEDDKDEEDANDNNFMDPSTTGVGNQQDGESWKYEPESIGGEDYYEPYDPHVPENPLRPQTGYGSAMREDAGYPGDVGLPLLIKPQTGNGNGKSAPERMGNAFWLLDFDGDQGNVRQEIAGECATASVGDPVPYIGGSHTGPTDHGVNDLIAQDPTATWNPSTKQVENSAFSDWTKSPRVIVIGLISPDYWIADKQNAQPDPNSVFTNFARMFILPPPQGPPGNIQAIFLGRAPGAINGEEVGPLVITLQLIE